MSLDETTLRSKLQLYLAQFIKCVQNRGGEDANSRVNDLIYLVEYLIGLKNNHPEFQIHFASYSVDSIRNEFKRSFYFICFKEILFTLNIAKLINSSNSQELKNIKTVLTKVISTTNFTDSFSILYDLCIDTKPSSLRDFCQYLLKQYLNKHLLKELFLENIHKSDETKKEIKILIEDPIAQKITNLPDKLANIYANNLNVTFIPKNYFKIVSIDLFLSIKSLHSLKKITSIEFISTVYGKMSLLGYSEVLSEIFLKNLIKMCYKDLSGLWSLVAQSFFKSIRYKYLESCLINLIKTVSSYEDIFILIGDSVVTNKDIQYLILEKFLFVKTLNKELSIQNLIGYIYHSQISRDLYYSVFKKLLNAWSSHTSITNTSYEQHLYLTKCILVCESYWDKSDKDLISQDLTKIILKGVEQHLHSPFSNLRTIGMIIGENLMNDLNSNYNDEKSGNNVLKFEYNETAETMLLKKLKQKPNTHSAFKNLTEDLFQLDLNSIQLNGIEENKNQSRKILFVNNKNLKITINEEDSDDDENDGDDLMPYDTSNDKPIFKAKQPAYLRDCLDTLIYSEDPEKIEITLKSVESLCSKYHFELQEICVELIKVLLHKSNLYAIENFEEFRLNAMISVAIHYPKESAEYLTSQFYDAGYSMTQRTDILHTLVMSIQRLSNPNENPIFDKRLLYTNMHQNTEHNLISFNKTFNNQPKDWKEQVQKRIDAKTKIKKTTKATVIKSKENIYSEIYGYFFFPLLRPYDVNRVHLNILEQDFMLLGKLIFSLAVILYSSTNTTILENMIKALLDFIWGLKNHTEPFVRSSILFALTIILIVTPKNLLLSTSNNYFFEMKFWLERIVINDPDLECQKKAIECLTIFSRRMKEQFANSE